jgi:hypothetical protein
MDCLSDASHLSETEKFKISHDVLKVAFNSLPELQFSDIIASYFNAFAFENYTHIKDIRTNRYPYVQNYIGQLWERARKNSDFLIDTKEFEPLLGELRLRDHFNHSFDVYLLGYYIINQIALSFPDKNYFKASEPNRNLIWMLTATFHDAAYAVERTDEWLNKFFQRFLGINPHFSLNLSSALTPVYTDFIRMLSQQHKNPLMPSFDNTFDSMDWTYYNAICEELANKNHGVLSALMLCHRMAIKEGFLGKRPKKDEQNKADDEWDFLLYHLRASHAISVHSVKQIKIEFQLHPYAYILILCDEIQDWGRANSDNGIDSFYLKRVMIQQGVRPRVFFEIEPYEKTDDLINTLNDRLKVNNEINISINGRDIHEDPTKD